MSNVTRRDALAAMGVTAGALAFQACAPADVDRAARETEAARDARGGAPFAPRFFTPAELATAAMLADMILPADGRSGSASDAGVPEFMDFVLAEEMTDTTRIRGGLAWLDHECRGRYSRRFTECTEEERGRLLDDLAWPERAPPSLSQGVHFFTAFRDLTASGFYSSRTGVQDLGYIGNTALREWTGCPEAQLKKLGVEYN